MESPYSLIENSFCVPINTKLAEIVGLSKAVILQQVYYWMEVFKNHKDQKERDRHFHDGRWWVYNSIKDWQEQLSFIGNSKTVWKHMDELENAGLLISGVYNKRAYDRTKWYSVDVELVRNLVNSDFVKITKWNKQNLRNGLGNNYEMDLVKSTQPIPYTSADTSSYTSHETSFGLKGAKTKVLCAENLTDQFDYDIVRRQISKACMEQGVSNAIQISDIQDIIIAFLMAYRYEKGEDHPRISQKEIGNIVDKIVYPIEELDGADLGFYKLIIERYFAKDYERGCDYHISHFFNEKIQKILCYEADYREVENIFA